MLADENHIRATFDQAAEEMQRAALIAADVTRASFWIHGAPDQNAQRTVRGSSV
jgi:hypothetical protein